MDEALAILHESQEESDTAAAVVKGVSASHRTAKPGIG